MTRRRRASVAVSALAVVAFATGCATPTPSAPTGAAGPGERADGARPLPIEGVRGSAQNACWLGPNRMLFTQFATGYNTGPATVRAATLDDSGHGVAADTPARGVTMPAGCASGGTIVYSADADGGDAVMAVDLPDGRPRTVLHRTSHFAWEPSFAPSGHILVFELHAAADGPAELWTVNLDGSGPRRLTTGADDRQPAWSPRGDAIVFQRHTADGWKVWTIDPQGGAPRQVTALTPGVDDTDPSWSPDARHIVFSSNAGGLRLANLFAIPAAGGTPTRLTTADAYDGAPAWSPDSTRIAFESSPRDPDGSAGTTLMVLAIPASLR